MISQLHGIIQSKQPLEVEVDLHGITFEVMISTRTYEALGAIDSPCHLFTHLIWREDQQYLVGFHTQMDRAWFRRLIKITGIGSKVAIAILSTLDPQGLYNIIDSQNAGLLTRVPGIGKKTAERVLLELSDEKTKQWMRTLFQDTYSHTPLFTSNQPTMSSTEINHNVCRDAREALSNLGYSESEIDKSIRHLPKENVSLDQFLRQALSYLSGQRL